MATKKKRARARVPKKKPKPVRYKANVSSFFTTSDAGLNRSRERVIKEFLPLTRKIYANLDARDGFDVRYLKHWSDSKVETVLSLIGETRRLITGEQWQTWKLYRPKSVAEADAMFRHTGQVSRIASHPVKAFVVLISDDKDRLRFVEEARHVGMGVVVRRLVAERVRAVKGGLVVYRDYLFREVLGFQPGEDTMEAAAYFGTTDVWTQIYRAMVELLPHLPDMTPRGEEAWYRLIGERGPVDTPSRKSMLLSKLRRYSELYDDSFVELIIGVRYQGDEFEAREKSVEALDSRMRYRKYADQRKKERRRVATEVRKREVIYPIERVKSKKKKSKRSVKKPKRSRKLARHK